MRRESLKLGDGCQTDDAGDGRRGLPLRAGANIADRLLDFGASVVALSMKLPQTAIGRHIGLQLARSATGAGANYEEARAAEGINDFVHKLSIAAKEMREAHYWVRLVERAFSTANISELARDAAELNAVLGASVRTARARQARQERD